MAGEYRQLFKEGLEMLMAVDLEKGDTSRVPKMMEYLALLENPDYKFGRITTSGGSQNWAPSELFLRS